MSIGKRVSGKIPPEKSPPNGIRGRVSVRLGIVLGLEYGELFSGEGFPRTGKRPMLIV